jgi:hypothetical protein
MSNRGFQRPSIQIEEGIDYGKTKVGGVPDNGKGKGEEGEEIDPDGFL